jgi:hypothetical protein
LRKVLTSEPRTVQIYRQARDFVNALLKERNTDLNELIRSGRLEPALFMMWASVKNILFRGMVPGAEKGFLRDYLASKGYSEEKLRPDTQVEMTVGDLEDLVNRTRKWAWSLRQSVIPIRGKALEKIVRLIVGDALKEIFASLETVKVTGKDTSQDPKFHNMDYTVFFSTGMKSVIVGFTVKGNIRERKDESVDTRRRALESKTHDQVWHVFLSEGGENDLAAFGQMDPSKDGEVYTWAGISESVGTVGIRPIGALPRDVLAYVKPRLVD